MHLHIIEWLQVLVFLGSAAIVIPLIGMYWSRLVEGKPTFLNPYLEWLENLSYRVAGINPIEEMSWTSYAKNLVAFNLCGLIFLFLLLLLQGYLPLNPQNFSGLSWEQALNVAVSFTTNTNWQTYGGESTMSYLSQMLGLTVQNFLSAATGSAVLMAMIRGITRISSATIGNFWADLVRSIVYLLLPLSIFLALVLVGQGVVQSFSAYETIETLENGKQILPFGPVASQEAIKQIGTNGGGFFNANSAHPFENPTALSNLLELIAMTILPLALIYSYGLLIGSRGHALLLLGVRIFVFIVGLTVALYSENMHNSVLDAFPLWEGKELRIGNVGSMLWGVITTVTSAGSVNMMHESLSPLAGGVLLFNMMIGEVVFGGIGIGLCSMIMFALLTVFLCGLMVGRTPEYLGKKLDKTDVQWLVLAVSLPNILILLGAGISSILPTALSSLSAFGPGGLTELLYAFTSTAMNNGSAFAGINSNTMYFNLVLSLVMLLGRLTIIIPSLALAGSFAAKRVVPASSGTLATNNWLFAILLLAVIIIIGGLAFLPALSLGPLLEHLLMLRGQSFPISEGA